jgi:hypothetical protein
VCEAYALCLVGTAAVEKGCRARGVESRPFSSCRAKRVELVRNFEVWSSWKRIRKAVEGWVQHPHFGEYFRYIISSSFHRASGFGKYVLATRRSLWVDLKVSLQTFLTSW